MRSSIPATPVRAADSGANFACTSRRTCAFWLLRAIQPRSAAAAGAAAAGACGAGWACPQAKSRAGTRSRRIPLLLLLRWLGARRRRFRAGLLPHQHDDVGGVLPELGRGADRGADADQLRVSDDPGLLGELERVGLHAAELVDGGKGLVERRLDLGHLLLRHLALRLRHLC